MADAGAPDPRLSAQGAAALEAAFLAAVPPDSANFLLGPFADVRAGRECDLRWKALYGGALHDALVNWIGARALRRAGVTAEGGLRLSDVLDNEEAEEAIDARFEQLLSSEMDRLKERAARAGPEELQALSWDPATVALVQALLGGEFYTDLKEGGRPTSSYAEDLHAVWMAVGVPGSRGPLPEADGLDSLLLQQLAVSALWVQVFFEIWLANNSGTPPAHDYASTFFNVPAMLPPVLVASIPPPSQREPNGPIPSDLPLRRPAFTLGEWSAFLDPSSAAPLAPATRRAILSGCITDLAAAGDAQLVGTLVLAALRVGEFAAWLKARGMSVLGVVVAEELLSRGGDPLAAVAADRSGCGAEVARTLGNSELPEAVRRRAAFRDALLEIEAALPPQIAAAYASGDFDAFSAAVAPLGLKEVQVQNLLSYLTMLRLVMMLVGSPEPFSDLAPKDATEQAQGEKGAGLERPPSELSSDASDGVDASDGSDASDSDPADALVRLWISTPPFSQASRDAVLISRAVRTLLSRFSADALRANILAPVACFSATHAAWFNLLVLKQFRWMLARASPAAQAGALDVFNGLVSDVEACMDLLEASGWRQHADVRLLLRGILEGEGTALTRADVQMLRSASVVASYCPHAGGGAEGRCWVCAADASRRRSSLVEAGPASPVSPVTPVNDFRQDEGEDDGEDAETALAVVELSLSGLARTGSDSTDGGRTGKRVRFVPLVRVHETYSKEEGYPSRTMHAPDVGEGGAEGKGGITAYVDAGMASLEVLLKQRGSAGLPNLKAYWS
ncbi:hypothetical protein DFJ74DRAFT_734808 [Hyaloraphidium curvatum]|nr:hypothetical protein DFJ74DRAFT_734808 [Hyaloraphidium curvatum]